jgi:transposase-like protein
LEKTITQEEVKSMKLKGKPKCPVCDNPLTFIFEGSTGFSGEKCSRCKREYLVNTETLEVIKITKVS